MHSLFSCFQSLLFSWNKLEENSVAGVIEPVTKSLQCTLAKRTLALFDSGVNSKYKPDQVGMSSSKRKDVTNRLGLAIEPIQSCVAPLGE